MMVMDALRGYLQLASGLTEVTKEKARQAAKAVVASASHLGERPADARSQVRALADELATTARANRDLLIGMVRVETERVVAGIGLASSDEVTALRRRVAALEARVGESATAQGTAATKKAAAKKAAASGSTTAKKAAPATRANPAKATRSAKKAAPTRKSTVRKAAATGSTQ